MTPDPEATADPFAVPARFTALRRLTALTLAPDGSRLIATSQEPDAKSTRYVSALWEIPLDAAGTPSRLTWSDEGESGATVAADGTVLFTSGRPRPDVPDDTSEPPEKTAALWALPTRGEARPRAAAPGGLSGPLAAGAADIVVAAGARLVGTAGDAGSDGTDSEDARRRDTRRERKISAILHTGMPIRHWDHELGAESPRLFVVGSDGARRDLTPDAVAELSEAEYTISADGTTVAITWRERAARGRTPVAAAVVDVGTGERRLLRPEPGWQYGRPVIDPGGDRVAVIAERDGTFERAVAARLELRAVDGGPPVFGELGDIWPTECAWSADGATVFVSGDLRGRGAVVAVDAATGGIRTRLAVDAAYTHLNPAPDGTVLYALRSTVDSAPTPVRLDPTAADQAPTFLPTPAPTPPLPGRVEELEIETPDGATVHAWLCHPGGSEPAPVLQWIHGGPFLSANAWSWRWAPWVFVAHGYAVVLPDPALSTGYGPRHLDRAWPYRADVVWSDVEAVLDAVVTRPDIDADRTALMGGSFGGFMTNWIAGQTERFRAIVTHAGLWALDQQHATTDAAAYKTGIFGTLAEHPAWYAHNSPHNAADRIRTPMLIAHGNRDYRVPVSEALRLWWDLVSRWDGDPDELPHRFLQFTSENHWVLTPANAEIWYETILAFLAQHVLGRPWRRPDLL